MKLTKSRLQQLVKEETSKALTTLKKERLSETLREGLASPDDARDLRLVKAVVTELDEGVLLKAHPSMLG